MNTTTPTDIRRILLALEPWGIHQASLELALHLARTHGVELAGLLIEDMNLLRAAGLPFTSEIMWTDAEERRLDPENLVRRLHAEAERLKESMVKRAESAGVRWSFHSVQAHDIRAALAEIKTEELMIMGRLSRTPWTRITIPPRIILLYTEAAQYPRFERMAHRLVVTLGETVLDISSHAVWENVQVDQPAQVLQTLRDLRPALVVAPADEWLERENLLRDLLDQLECPLVIIRQWEDNKKVTSAKVNG